MPLAVSRRSRAGKPRSLFLDTHFTDHDNNRSSAHLSAYFHGWLNTSQGVWNREQPPLPSSTGVGCVWTTNVSPIFRCYIFQNSGTLYWDVIDVI
eukprot:1028881-Rhodomonas_salina.2